MCGILGIISKTELAIDVAAIRDMMYHRGPDDAGLLWYGPHSKRVTETQAVGSLVVLAHRRLSILDLSSHGHQPMSSADGRWHIVYNGEVYNYIELKTELVSAGYAFTTQCDTEVVLAAVITWGCERAITRFRGMFAFAVLDAVESRIYLARDPFGIKPLYLCRWRDGIAFASEIAALKALPGVDLSLNADRCFEYLRYGITDHGERTLLKGVLQMPPAHWSTATINAPDGVCQFLRYWEPVPITVSAASFDENSRRFRELFLDTVRLHMRSDVPVGAALSGGLDSSALVCAIRHLFPDQQIHTFSYVSDDARTSEWEWMDRANRHVGAIPHPVRVSSKDLLRDLGALIRSQGEPFGSSTIYAQSAVFRAARETGIPVMLDGQGADELLAGYDVYQGTRVASLLRGGNWWRALRLLQAQRNWAGRSRMRAIAWAANSLLPASLRSVARAVYGRSDRPAWARREWFRDHAVAMRYPFATAGGSGMLQRQLRADLTQHGLLQLLRYEDRNSMAWSVESRVPFLEPALVAFCQGLPEEHMIDDRGESKRIMRAALRGIVPDVVLDRRDKLGFTTPEAKWLRDVPDLARRCAELATEVPCLDPPEVEHYLQDFLAGKDNGRFQAWRLVNFVIWHHDMIHGRSPW